MWGTAGTLSGQKDWSCVLPADLWPVAGGTLRRATTSCWGAGEPGCIPQHLGEDTAEREKPVSRWKLWLTTQVNATKPYNGHLSCLNSVSEQPTAPSAAQTRFQNQLLLRLSRWTNTVKRWRLNQQWVHEEIRTQNWHVCLQHWQVDGRDPCLSLCTSKAFNTSPIWVLKVDQTTVADRNLWRTFTVSGAFSSCFWCLDILEDKESSVSSWSGL